LSSSLSLLLHVTVIKLFGYLDIYCDPTDKNGSHVEHIRKSGYCTWFERPHLLV